MPTVYFISDFHLFSDVNANSSSLDREKKIVLWLESISHDTGILHLVGDIFDYWFEYKTVVPKGGVRLLGKLATMHDNGWEIHYHVGNHDMWVGSYIKDEIGLIIHTEPLLIQYGNKKFFIAHGDGLGSGDIKYKIIRFLLRSKFNQFLFARIHPNLGLYIMKASSLASRKAHNEKPTMDNLNEERLYKFANDHSKLHNVDFYVFGHRHLPSTILLENNSSFYICLGDWLKFCTYGIYAEENGGFELKSYAI